jgi:antitoxin component HigA of HigAB toxin-antitoxin module
MSLVVDAMKDPEVRRAVEREWPFDETIVAIERAMKRGGLSRVDLAEKLGWSNATVTQTMRYPRALTLEKLVDIAEVLGCRVLAPRLQKLSKPAPWEKARRRGSNS